MFVWPLTGSTHSSSTGKIAEGTSDTLGKPKEHVKLCGVGDHLTATFDAMLMVAYI